MSLSATSPSWPRALLTSLCMTAMVAGQQPANLHLSVRPGEKRCYRYVEESRRCGEGRGNQSDWAETLSLEVSCEVLAVAADGAVDTRFAITRIVLASHDADGSSAAQDSANPQVLMDEADAGFPFRELCGHAMRAHLAADGELLQLDGCDSLLAKANGWAMASITCHRVLDAGKLRRIAASLFGALPERRIAAGGAWMRCERQGLGVGERQIATTWRFGAVGDKQLELLGVGVDAAAPRAHAAAQTQCPRRVECEEMCRQLVDKSTGWTASLDRHRTESVQVALANAIMTWHSTTWTHVEPIAGPTAR